MLKSLKNTEIQGKTILYRAPYDIETEMKDGKIAVKDDSRIKCTIPTLKYLLSQNCKIVILTWVGRPENGPEELLSTKVHAQKLSELIGAEVIHIDDCVGTEVKDEIAGMKPKEIIMLENTRFHKEEYDDNDEFAAELCKGLDLIVFDAFPQAHRKHSSTTGILRHLPSCAGLYFETEYNSLSGILTNPTRPFTVIIGGAKTSDKIDAINNLYDLADIILVGGGIANAFMKAEGKNMGSSFIEAAYVDTAKGEKQDILQFAKQIMARQSASRSYQHLKTDLEINLKKIQLPYDFVIGKDPKDDSEYKLAVAYNQTDVVPIGWGAYDIGPMTCKLFSEIIMQSKTVFWAGPIGIYEKPNYAKGTKVVVDSMCSSDANTIVAGGDTIDALDSLGDPSKIKHISLAGGATLDFVSGKDLPVLKYLMAN